MMSIVNINPDQLISLLRDVASSDAQVSVDSRHITNGDIFLAYPVGRGAAFRDGRQYIAMALENGASAVVFDPADGVADEYLDHPQCFAISNLATIAGKLCSEWYDNPSKKLKIIGVTGTNGKTSVTQWLAQALDVENHRTAVVGTLGTGFPGALLCSGYTTPDAPRLQKELNGLLKQGAKQVVMEISSHALDQGRVAGLNVSCAVFTNLTQDHLDYHGTMADYAQAKEKLFSIPTLENAVINFDDPFGRELAVKLLAANKLKVWGYALTGQSFSGFEKFGERLKRIYVKDLKVNSTGYDAKFASQDFESSVLNLPVLGEFNLSNCLAVWTVLLTQGLNPAQASERMGQLSPVPGRMELIQLNKSLRTDGPLVVVDYAHTPDALAKALIALRPVAMQRGGKIWCVFGCGGDRDSSKRPQMGRVAQEHADHIVLTSDNPRSEEPEVIIEMIRSGMTKESENIQSVPDRAAAIMTAVRHADLNDVILVAGKGHESTQEVKGKKFDFSDQEHIRLAAGVAL